MKRYSFTLLARIIIIAALATAVWIFECNRGIFPGKSAPLLLTEKSIEKAGTPLSITLGALNLDEVGALVAANGGVKTSTDSLTAKKNLTLRIELFPDRPSLEQAFARGKIQVMTQTPSRLASIIPTMDSLTPVAFLMTGKAPEKPAIISRSPLLSAGDLSGKTIACTRGSLPFYFVRMIADSYGSEEHAKWIFTSSDAEAVNLLKKNKADIIAIDMRTTPAPEGYTVSLDSDAAPLIFSSILVAQESDIALHQETFRSLVSAHFDGRKLIASKKDADARDLLLSLNVSIRDNKHPALSIPSDQDNILFFRLTLNRRWDFIEQYTLGIRPAGVFISENERLPAESLNTTILSSLLQSVTPRNDSLSAPEASARTSALTLSYKKFSFSTPDNDIEREQRHLFSKAAIALSAFPQSIIAISLGGDTLEERNFYYQRELAVRTLLTQQGVPPSRIMIVKDKGPALSVIIPAGVKK